MIIDYPTLLVTASWTTAAFGVLGLILARAEPALRPLLLGGLGNLCFAAGMPLLILRGGGYDVVGIVFGNAFILAGWGLQAIALRHFLGRPAWVWLVPVACLAWFAACLLPAFLADAGTRMALASGLTAVLAGLVAGGLGRIWTGRGPFRIIIVVLSGAQPTAQVLRIAAVGLHGPEAAMAMNPAIILTGLAAILVCTVILITEALRRANQQAQGALTAAHAEAIAARDDFAGIVEGMPSIIYVNRIRPDLRWTRIFLSGNTERVIGWPRDQLHADDSLETRTEWAPAEMRAALQELTATGSVVVEFQMRRPDGSRVWVRRESRIATRHVDGSVEVVGFITDITAERALAAKVLASAKLASLGEMATGLAHELGQPAAIMGLAAGNAAAALRRAGAAAIPDALRRLERIVAQAERMGVLMNQFKAFARAEPISLGPVDLAQALSGALVLTEAALREASIGIEIAIPDGLPPVRGSLVPLEQVLVNLLVNARHAMAGQPESLRRQVRIAAWEAEPGQIVLEVGDTGGGLAPEMLARAFEPFVTTKPMGEGLGLGLSVSHGLVRAMGGELTAANRDGGAVFTITLGCAEPALAA